MSSLRAPMKVSATSLMLDWLEATFPDIAGNVGVNLPTDDTPLPYQQVFQVTGTDDGLQREPTLDIYTFDRRWKDAEERAMLVDEALLRYSHLVVASGGKTVVIDRVYVLEEAVELPWDSDLRVTRFKSTIQLVTRG